MSSLSQTLKAFFVVAFSLVSLSASSQETTVIKKDYDRGKIELRFKQVIVDSFETFELISDENISMRLICANNRSYKNKLPIIKYRNLFNIQVADFVIDSDQKCINLRKHLLAVFEMVNDDNPLLIELDRKTKMVSKIIYPDIDPYLKHIEMEQEPSDLSLENEAKDGVDPLM